MYWNKFVLIKSLWGKKHNLVQKKIIFTNNTFCTVVIYEIGCVIIALHIYEYVCFLTGWEQLSLDRCCFSSLCSPAILVFLNFTFFYILMVISNLICIQITSPGGTPIRGKNAGYRKRLVILLSCVLPLSSIASATSVCPHFQLSVLFTCSNTFSAFTK